MKLRQFLFVSLILGTCVAAAMAGGPVSPEGHVAADPRPEIVVPAGKDLGDANDWYAATMAGADYLVGMQADITEDNAGNGSSDNDPDDGGFDWRTQGFSHSGVDPSWHNLYGVTAQGLLRAYQLDPDPASAIYIAMRDVADGIVTRNSDGDPGNDCLSAPDISFLIDFADLGVEANPQTYRDAAKDIWDARLGSGSVADLVNTVVNGRLSGNDDGIIPWDLTFFVIALTKLDDAFPSNSYGDDAVDIVDLMYAEYYTDDSTLASTFDPTDPTTYGSTARYTLGLASFIRAIVVSGASYSPDPLPTLKDYLYASQMPDGGFAYYYDASSAGNYSSWQTTAYASMAVFDSDGGNVTGATAIRDAAAWLALTQDSTSGAWVYSSGNHYPEIGGEATSAMGLGWLVASPSITAAPDAAVVGCGDDNLVTFSLDVNTGTPTIAGVEVVLEVTADTTVPSSIDIDVATGLNPGAFYVTGSNPYSVNIAFYGGAGIDADTDLFTVDLSGFTEGDVTLAVNSYRMRDPNNDPIFGDVTGTSFNVDCTAPPAVENIVATPGHTHVDVAWTHPDETDVAGYEIFRGLWYWDDNNTITSTYPEYDDQAGATVPTRPADHAAAVTSSEWEYAGTVTAGTFTFEDNNSTVGLPRGVYYYEVFAVDAVDNGSDQAADGNDRATSYWLGDVSGSGDGEVGTADIGVLGAAFGTTESGGGAYNNYVDVGPTDTGSRLGIPTTDNAIDFEDLMIFALNFGVVSASAKSEAPISPMAQLAWVEAGEGRYALRLVDGVGIKGVRVRASVPVGSVVAGDLLDRQDEMTFLRNIGTMLDVSVAVMGVGQGFEGTGDLLVVESTETIAAGDLRLDVRGHDNSEVQVALDQTVGSVVPRAFELHANYPNPFNPMTKISFSLPQSQPVKLAVYAVDGTLVRTLMNETREAGLHEVLWNGRNDAGRLMSSGTYFCRIEAGPYSQVRKMSLMK